MNNPYIVTVILNAKSGRELELKQELISVAESSRKESTCLAYHVHQDLNNPAQILLYEKWKSKVAHQLQFQKSYILALGAKLETLLAKPYQVIFAEEIN